MTLGALDQPAVLWSFADYILYKQVSEELYGFTGLQGFLLRPLSQKESGMTFK